MICIKQFPYTCINRCIGLININKAQLTLIPFNTIMVTSYVVEEEAGAAAGVEYLVGV